MPNEYSVRLKRKLTGLGSIGALCLLLSIIIPGVAGQAPAQESSRAGTEGSITGRVWIKSEPAPGVSVMLLASERLPNSGYKLLGTTRTDAEGRFTLAGLTAAQYLIRAFAPAYWSNEFKGVPVVLTEGQQVDGVEIHLIRGGVITGRILDKDRHPLPDQSVDAENIKHPTSLSHLLNRLEVSSDDRGIYRLYGLPPGQYVVHAGVDIENTSGLSGRAVQRLTYAPGVSDRKDAAVIQVESGSEISGVDIIFGDPRALPRTLFEVNGRVMDAARGLPAASATVSYTRYDANGSSGSSYAGTTDAEGYFKLRGLKAGRYSVSAAVEGSNTYCEPAAFEIKNDDVSNLIIKLYQGLTISGIVQAEDPRDSEALSNLSISGVSLGNNGSPNAAVNRISSYSRISPDGTFQLAGLRPGQIALSLYGPGNFPGFAITQIEHPGAQLSLSEDPNLPGRSLVMTTAPPGVQLNGVRLSVVRLTGGIHGTIKFIGGALPPGYALSIQLSMEVGDRRSYGFGQVRINPDGTFNLMGLPPAQYELQVIVSPSHGTSTSKSVLVDKDIVDVEIILDVSKLSKSN